jgi:hypothetical protein
MNLITHPTPKSNENDLKVIAEIERLGYMSENHGKQFTLGYWIEKYFNENGLINLDQVIFIEKYTSTQDDIIKVEIPCIRFETIKQPQYLYFDSVKSRDEYYDFLQRISILPIVN